MHIIDVQIPEVVQIHELVQHIESIQFTCALIIIWVGERERGVRG